MLVSIDIVESQAIAKGISPADFANLKAMLANLKGGYKSTSPFTKKTVKKYR